MKPSQTPDFMVPDAPAFRAWLQDSLALVGTNASAIGRDLGMGKNSLGDFLRDPGRDIQLSTVQRVTVALRIRAADQGVALPHIWGAQNER